MINDITLIILKIIIAISITIITRFLIPYLKGLIAGIQDEKLRQAVKDAIQTAEQTIKGSGMGAIKKSDVSKYMLDWCKNHGIELTATQLDQLIESAVYAMNNNKLSS